MIKKVAALLLALVSFASAADAAAIRTPPRPAWFTKDILSGPLPASSPWTYAYPDISFSIGGVLLPRGVTGGSQGVGTLNASGLYVGGVPVLLSTATPGSIGALAIANYLSEIASAGGTAQASARANLGISGLITPPVTVANGGTNCTSASGTCLDNITGFSSTGLLKRTGAGAYSFAAISSSAQTAIANATNGTGGLLTYGGVTAAALGASGTPSSSTFLRGDWSWATVSGGGVTSVACGAGLTGGTITTTGTCAVDATQSVSGGIQQTVQSGPESSGLPNFLPATSGSLSITTQNVSGSAPLVLNAWDVLSGSGVNDLTCSVTSNARTWSSLTASQAAVFLYATLSTSGGTCTVTPGITTLVPIYQLGGTPSVTSGQITCNIAKKQCYLGNGSSAPQTTIVVLGEVVTNGSGVTSSVAYAYGGYYDSGWTSTLPSAGTPVSKNSNLGVDDALVSLDLKCLSAEAGYSVGDHLPMAQGGGWIWTLTNSRNTVGVVSPSGQSPSVLNKSNGNSATLTASNWAYRLIAKRRW